MEPDTLNRRLALLGAVERIRQLQLEANQIYSLYPELRRQHVAAEPRPTGGHGRHVQRLSRRDRKKAVSDGMRRYWAKRKAQEKSAKKA